MHIDHMITVGCPSLCNLDSFKIFYCSAIPNKSVIQTRACTIDDGTKAEHFLEIAVSRPIFETIESI